jgi:HlyD family secretion protein
MPVEAFIRTRDRRPVDYLLEPLTRYLSRAMREG